MNKNNQGFSVVEVFIVIVILGLVGIVGWFTYDRQQKVNKPNSSLETTTPTDTTITYSVEDAIDTIDTELAKDNKLKLSKDDIRLFLNTSDEWLVKFSGTSSDREQFIDSYPFPIDYIKFKLSNPDNSINNQRIFTEEELEAIYKAEEVYLVKIGAIDPVNKENVKAYNRIN